MVPGLLLVRAPPLDTPVPLMVSGSAVPSVYPFKSRDAPLVIDVLPATVPKGELVPSPAAPSLSVPALMVVAPV